jgi:hypothetical protein
VSAFCLFWGVDCEEWGWVLGGQGFILVLGLAWVGEKMLQAITFASFKDAG